ncbi:MAG: hypothetical protein J6U14_03895 [Bacteroidaceae bacterium]|nr:hypothetical protein [Bacteroidaceae bacterium]
MKKIYLYFAMLATVAAACTKDESAFLQDNGALPADTPEVKMIIETISARSSSSTITRAAIADDGGAFSWTAGDDHIAVHVSKDDNHEYVFTSEEGGSGATVDGDDSSTASFTVAYQMGYTRDAFAVFPSTIVSKNAANYGQSGSTLDVTLPGSYKLDQVTGTRTPCPMIATNTGDSWDFYQLCGLLRLKVSNLPATTKRLEIDFDGKKVWGDFSIAADVTPGTSVIATTADADHDIITITKDGTTDAVLGETNMDLNIPLPTGSYSNITVTAYDALTAGTVTFTMTTAFAYSAQQAHGTKITVKVPFPPGEFSVNADGKKVIFAPGNLQYLGNADGPGTWRFAENQYDFMGDGPEGTSYKGNVTVSGYTKYNTSADKDVARDLFGWGTSGFNGKNPWMTTTTSSNYYSGSLSDTDYDWGVYHSASGSSNEKITNGGDYKWRLFTSDEWAYIIAREGRVYTRADYTQIKKLFAGATVVGVKGLILFPDNWDGSLYRTIIYGNDSNGGYSSNIFDAEKWSEFEDAGCVFLPAAHVRSGTSLDYLNQGHYWSGTVISGRGGTLEFGSTGTVITSRNNNNLFRLGNSVRLVRDKN